MCRQKGTSGNNHNLLIQLMDDVRLFEKETGVASGAMPIPVLLAKDEFPELNHLIQNGFHTESDIKKVSVEIFLNKVRCTIW